ncbi:glycosyltransferase family 8 protein [Saccharicrinis aurantiacus]|uniref:glycosyltransferase family 8 protein n=1 Tax=Saccharicrinis aurantiacus TaxID=1849719 RepID=UPI0008395686|nr:glycosyltransferase family 8 protein [Saccharicrinis aurantiacus]
MNIPIVFSFDNKFTIPAGVCITSLLKNTKEGVYYTIYILYSSSRLNKTNINKITSIQNKYTNCSFNFIDVKNSFHNSYEVRDVTIESYYRLLIPTILGDIPKVIYCDVDVIINKDISDLFALDISGKSIAGVQEHPNFQNKTQIKYIHKLNLKPSCYINAGVLLFNNTNINSKYDYKKTIKEMSVKKFKFQDQDILNIIFQNDIYFLPNKYNYTLTSIEQGVLIKEPSIFHYILAKPWNEPKLFGDLWWEYYKKSIFFDEDFYCNYLYNNLELSRHIRFGKILQRVGVYKMIDFLRR